MQDKEVKEFTTEIFSLIEESTTISELESIIEKNKELKKNILNAESYPKIEFKITVEEIEGLKKSKLLDNDFNLTKNIFKTTDPLTKLLYSVIWKNGDLKKIKHIIKGIVTAVDDENNQEEALVFYQFGRYLTKTPGQPIIDQHVIRAYGIFQLNDIKKVGEYRKLQTLNKAHKNLINEYKKWHTSDKLTKELKAQPDYTYHIDKILFALGKTIKSKKSKS